MDIEYRETTIDDTDLDRELREQPAKYLYVAEKAVIAQGDYELFKSKREQLYATLDKKVREKAAAEKAKITEAAIKNEIELNEDYQKATAHLINLRTQSEMLKSLRDSWHMRKDLLIQVAIKQRSELDSMLKGRIAVTEAA